MTTSRTPERIAWAATCTAIGLLGWLGGHGSDGTDTSPDPMAVPTTVTTATTLPPTTTSTADYATVREELRQSICAVPGMGAAVHITCP